MATRRPRPLWGWTGPARGLLILMTGFFATTLAWSSRSEPVKPGPPIPFVVDPNTVPGPVLVALPGLGPVLAGRIVEARQRAPFRSLDDFDRRVKGIGPVKVATLRPFFRFEGRPSSSAR